MKWNINYDSISYQTDFKYANITDFTWFDTLSLVRDDLSKLSVQEKVLSDVTKTYALVWKTGTNQAIPQNWIEALRAPSARERFINAFQGFGFVTNQEISDQFERKKNILESTTKSGIVISVRGKSAAANIIKTISGEPWTHTAIFYVDDNDERWVLDMQGAWFSQGLRKTALNQWLEAYAIEGVD